jgi:hypothetical protein
VKVDSGFEYPGADLESVITMLTDAEFQRARCAATGALDYSVTATGAPNAPILTCRRRMSTDGLPDFMRKIVGASVEVIDAFTWAPDAGNGQRTADVKLSFAAQPTTLVARLTVHDDQVGTHGRLAGDLKAGIPLFGSRVENAIAPLIQSAIAIEQTVGRQWLKK